MVLATVVAGVVAAGMSVRASDTDDRIESSFKTSYVYKTYLKEDSIKISSKSGVVTLSGSVLNEDHKPMAQSTAEALPGVKSVDNRIKIPGDGPAERSDTWIGMKVKTTLLYHRNVSGFGTTVKVKDGIVTLTGEASSNAQKDLTGAYAKDIDGVKDVSNEMIVSENPKKAETTGESIDDASITAQVKAALLAHRSTSAVKTQVTTTDGVVTLSGVAKNSAEKDLAGKYAEDINGVKSVVNNMTTK